MLNYCNVEVGLVLVTVCWARQEDADRPCLDTHDKFFFFFLNSTTKSVTNMRSEGFFTFTP